LIAWIPLAVMGLFTLGPSALLYALALAIFWLPASYVVLAPPFLLTGLIVAVILRKKGSVTLIDAAIASLFAFSAYFVITILVIGTIPFRDWITLPPREQTFGAYTSAVILLPVTTAICWRIGTRRHVAATPAN
jgi:hypothetical protein